MAVSTALFSWLGSLLDERLNTKPLFVLIGGFLGFAGGFYSMYWRLVIKGPGRTGDDG
jgi:F0F1-type ATP synthase assembly protein I